MNKIPAKWLILFITLLIMTSNVLLGFVLTKESRASMKVLMDNRMLDIVKTASSMLDGDALGRLKAEDKGSIEYQRVNDTLAHFQENIELKYIYCIRDMGNDEFVFTVDPTIDNPGEFGAPIVYTDALHKASLGTASADEEAYSDAWGRFYSAYAPVFDSSGRVSGIVAVDFSADWYDEQIAIQTRAIAFCIAFSLLMCVSLGWVVTKRTRELEIARENLESMRSDRDHYKSHSETDQLTGLLNKKTTEELATERLPKLDPGKINALYMLDLDHFKEANDTYGHSYGDKVLASFAAGLHREFRADDIVGRFGGDEFIVLISDLENHEIVERKARQILDIARGLTVEGKNAGMSVSIGIALAPQDGETYEEIFQAADSALYRVKSGGRNGYCIGREREIHR